MTKIDRSEITPEHLYMSRRKFIAGLGATAGAAALAACRPATSAPTTAPETPTPEAATPTPVPETPTSEPASPTSTPEDLPATATPPGVVAPHDWAAEPGAGAETDDLGDALTSYPAVNTYNNFYEFTFNKSITPAMVKDYESAPWEVEVGGLVENPRTLTLEDLLSFPHEERIYRMRCVEGWSMVIPWIGYPLSKLLDTVQPTAEAQFVRFETVYRPEQMPNQRNRSFPWPYVEGLRLDEAMHDLTIVATGLYRKPLTPQTGAPFRLVVPWKYGFKSIKAIVKVDLVAEMPESTWVGLQPHEYGFYANVNPDVPHPRWSQATERRIGEGGRRKTLMFNGYGDEVAHLYEGMDLRVNY